MLNSRPLVPLTTDPNDLEAITPAHFIIGEALNALPQPNLLDTLLTHVLRFQLLQKKTQHFWSRWRRDYLHTLHQRSKWKVLKDCSQLVGSLVVLHEDNLPPSKWALGRITATHPGTDNIVRVVTVWTKGGTVKRSITKLSILPVN